MVLVEVVVEHSLLVENAIGNTHGQTCSHLHA